MFTLSCHLHPISGVHICVSLCLISLFCSIGLFLSIPLPCHSCHKIILTQIRELYSFFFFQNMLAIGALLFHIHLNFNMSNIILLQFSLRLPDSINLGRIDIFIILSLPNYVHCLYFNLFSPLISISEILFSLQRICASFIGLTARYFILFEEILNEVFVFFKFSNCDCCLYGNVIDFAFHSLISQLLFLTIFSVDTFSFLCSRTYHLWIIGFVSFLPILTLFIFLLPYFSG